MDSKLCVTCRGKSFCGKPYCPILSSLTESKKEEFNLKKEIFGSSPPSIFIGRVNYPEVRAGPALPPFLGNTSIYDLPELWVEIPIEKIVEMRSSLILANLNINVRNTSSKEALLIQEVALYNKPVELEVSFEKIPKPRIILDDFHPPMGPSAPARQLRICSTPKAPAEVEKVYEDREMSAIEAIKYLYEKGIAVSHIQKLLSAGTLGRERRFVPTRWAITAVDDTISKLLVREIKHYNLIDSYQVFVFESSKNLFMVILMPSEWSFEWGEAWYPNTTWNFGNDVLVDIDWEGYKERKTYASTGGCYYSARLAIAEYLRSVKRQASAIVWREIYPGFKTAIGVWFVREMLRKCLSQNCECFEELKDALNYLSNYSKFGVSKWVERSKILGFKRKQARLWDFS
ncbi:MAG: Nre family DNA repair protein [Archaeoglobales archaeon]|nr:Nre family DNA repair protein [Archaeoglobales archaeon]